MALMKGRATSGHGGSAETMYLNTHTKSSLLTSSVSLTASHAPFLSFYRYGSPLVIGRGKVDGLLQKPRNTSQS